MEKNLILESTTLNLDEILSETIQTDLHSLNVLLDIKLKALEHSSSKDYKIFNFEYIYNSKNEDVDLLKTILKKALLLSEDILEPLEQLIKYIIENQDVIENQNKVIAILDTLCKFCYEKSKLDYLFSHLTLNFITNYLLKISNSNDNKVEAYEILRYIFHLLPDNDQVCILNSIYTFCQNTKNFEIFCAILNQTKSIIIESDSCYLNNDNFFEYLEGCLSGNEAVLRKQASAILLKYINEFNGITKINHYFYVDEKHLNNSWDIFFLLLDMAKEKQLHLVTPALNLFMHVTALHPLWQRCIYTIYLDHSQTVIIYKVAIHLMENFNQKNNYIRDFIKLLLKAINIHEYSVLSRQMFSVFYKFCQLLTEYNFTILLEEILLVSWTSIALWEVIQNIFNDKNEHVIQLHYFSEILYCVNRLPHVFIRNKCTEILMNFFRIQNDLEANWLQLNKIAGVCINKEKYFNLCDIPNDSTEFLINKLISLNKDAHVDEIRICLIFLQKNLDKLVLMSTLQNHLNKFNCHVKLLIFHWYCLNILPIKQNRSIRPKILREFMLEYFRKYLKTETVDYFLCILNELEKYYRNLKIILPRIIAILTDSKSYSANQIYMAIYQLNRPLYARMVLIIKKRNIEDCVADIVKTCEKDTRIFKEYLTLLFRAKNKILSSSKTREIIELFKKSFDDQPNDVIDHICKLAKTLLQRTEAPKLLFTFIYFVFEKLMFLKKDQNSKMIICRIFEIVFCDELLNLTCDSDLTIISHYLTELCEKCPLVRAQVMKIVKDSIYRRQNDQFPHIFESVVELYLKGMVSTKNERIEYEVCKEFLHKNGNNTNIYAKEISEYTNFSPNLLKSIAKFYALNIITALARRNLKVCIPHLMRKYLRCFNRRYHNNSEIHFKKLRLAQALLLMTPFLKQDYKVAIELGTFLFNCFFKETNQPCVRQLFSLIIIKLLQDYNFEGVEYISRIITANKTNISPSTIITLIPILYHLVITDKTELLKTCDIVIKLALPWTMGADFNLRLHAQYLIKTVLSLPINNLKKFNEKYEYFELCLQNILDSNESLIKSNFKSDRMFLENFKFTSDYCLRTFFYHIPRLNKVHESEWENSHLFFTELFENTIQRIPINENRRNFSDSIDTYLYSINKQVSEDEEHLHINIQKKMIPSMSTINNSRKKANFILIASLIEKPQNLGGLCRTCEVFGIKNLIINNIHVIQDKEFQSLSVSSETNLNIQEVKIQDLEECILEYRKQGYFTIGAEQTLRSEKLNEYHFPKKIVLLLGNEKTGIPTELLPLLNVCLEIPQIGQTRSLNVHVAGAIFIWEYAKQHLK